MNLKQIVYNAKKGDSLSQALLYQQFAKPMYNLCIKLLGNVHNAEDILQEGFIHAFEKINQLNENDLFGGWLKKIIVNKCFAFLNSNKINFLYNDLSEDVDIIDEDDEVEEEITPTEINDAIAKLPNGCRQILILFLLENFSHKQIASLLKISESTSKSQYQYGKKLLKNFLKKNKIAI